MSAVWPIIWKCPDCSTGTEGREEMSTPTLKEWGQDTMEATIDITSLVPQARITRYY